MSTENDNKINFKQQLAEDITRSMARNLSYGLRTDSGETFTETDFGAFEVMKSWSERVLGDYQFLIAADEIEKMQAQGYVPIPRVIVEEQPTLTDSAPSEELTEEQLAALDAEFMAENPAETLALLPGEEGDPLDDEHPVQTGEDGLNGFDTATQ